MGLAMGGGTALARCLFFLFIFYFLAAVKSTAERVIGGGTLAGEAASLHRAQAVANLSGEVVGDVTLRCALVSKEMFLGRLLYR